MLNVYAPALRGIHSFNWAMIMTHGDDKDGLATNIAPTQWSSFSRPMARTQPFWTKSANYRHNSELQVSVDIHRMNGNFAIQIECHATENAQVMMKARTTLGHKVAAI